nr:MAG TPA_asm: hypothetical protein [Caudoviricetes sp.]
MLYIDNALMIFDNIAGHRQTPEDACPAIVII